MQKRARHAARITLAAAACLCIGGAAMLLVGWLAGRALTDRTLITQYAFWAPSVIVIPLGATLALLGFLAARSVRSPVGARSTPPRRRRMASIGIVLFAAWSLAAAWVVTIDWRLARSLFPPERLAPQASLRVLNWNMTTPDCITWSGDLAAISPDRRPDLLFLSTSQPDERLRQSVSSLGPECRITRQGLFAVVSRFPVTSFVQRSLLLTSAAPASASGDATPPTEPPAPRTRPPPLLVDLYNQFAQWRGLTRRQFDQNDPGTVTFIEIDTTAALGRPISVWYLDLPSSPMAPRFALARAAAARINDLLRRPSPGMVGSMPVGSAPDLVLGDFNIPRGSASLAILTRGLSSAYDLAGRGHAASWPRVMPLFHIDHAFLAPTLRAGSYRVVDPGLSDHRAQVFDIAAGAADAQ